MSASLSDYEGQEIILVVQAWMGGCGWVTCDYATDLVDAKEKAERLASKEDAWMPSTAAMTAEQRLQEFVRIANLEACSGSLLFAIQDHNRRAVSAA